MQRAAVDSFGLRPLIRRRFVRTRPLISLDTLRVCTGAQSLLIRAMALAAATRLVSARTGRFPSAAVDPTSIAALAHAQMWQFLQCDDGP